MNKTLVVDLLLKRLSASCWVAFLQGTLLVVPVTVPTFTDLSRSNDNQSATDLVSERPSYFVGKEVCVQRISAGDIEAFPMSEWNMADLDALDVEG